MATSTQRACHLRTIFGLIAGVVAATSGQPFCGWCPAAEGTAPAKPALEFINTGFENASPLQWETDADGTVHVHVLYDYERSSPNRAAGHWHFQLQGRPGSDLTLVLHNFENIYNGRPGVPVSKKSICYVSADGKQWKVVPAEFLAGNLLRIRVYLDGPSLYLARLEPYRLADLERLLDKIRGNRLVEIEPIGKTVEGRPLEIVRVGDPQAPHRVLLRARAHAWEPGGNWIVQGLINALLEDDETSRKCLKRYCVYVLPMANKDAVARGLTRFNMLGRDLNRDWDRPSDPELAPENFALESWIQRMVEKRKAPDLAIDLHNDESGGLHICARPSRTSHGTWTASSGSSSCSASTPGLPRGAPGPRPATPAPSARGSWSGTGSTRASWSSTATGSPA